MYPLDTLLTLVALYLDFNTLELHVEVLLFNVPPLGQLNVLVPVFFEAL